MKTMLVVLFLIPARALTQSDPSGWPGLPDIPETSPGTPGPAESDSPRLDSLNRRLASIECLKAREAAAATDFWHRLIPRVSAEGGIGLRDLVFPDAGGLIVYPKDSYRITVSISLSAILDGTAHVRAELQVAEAETRCAILVHRQTLARMARGKKRDDLTIALGGLTEELRLRDSAASCRELLFIQGRADFQAVAAARIELIRLQRLIARLEMRLTEPSVAEPGIPPP